MNKNILVAVPFGAVAVTALLLSFRSSMSAESLIGYAGVAALLAVAAIAFWIALTLIRRRLLK